MMNCEQVKGLLSPYLDYVLAEEERRAVALHLETCPTCSAILADFRHFDILLSQLPRVSPGANLRETIFSSPEYLELMGTSDSDKRRLEQTIPYRSIRNSTVSREQDSQLAAFSNDRKKELSSSFSGVDRDLFIAPDRTKVIRPRHRHWGQRVLQTALVATVLLALSVGGLIGWNLWQRQNMAAQNTDGITPPAALQQGPIPAGIRFLFLRNGALWSAPSDGSTAILRLTPVHTTVAEKWVVRPAQAGRSAGNLVAYIDLQQGFVHLIRSDGQNDTVIQQPLLKHGVQPSTLENTDTGATILSSLTWSNDGSKLAFLADPTGTAQPQLYIYTVSSNELHTVTLPAAGAVSHLVWSPDSIRIAFEVTHSGFSDVLDYNTQNQGILTLPTGVNTQANGGNITLALDWSPDINAPALTWSLGQTGHTHTIWVQRVGMGATTKPILLASGDYLQAVYSRTGHNGVGSWLLVTNNAGTPGDVISVDLASSVERLTVGKQVYVAQWSPDGNAIDYFEALSNGMGVFHVVNTTTGTDTLIASRAAAEPLPAWSADSQRVVYSTGGSISIVDLRTPGVFQTLKQQGKALALSWSITSPAQLVLAIGDGQRGLYLVDGQNKTSLQLSKEPVQGPILWTEIP
ncbi:MAG: PD40 domain-containing protein [Ktedonobacteraceae bacterium]|nr:PD40 domain-containing protein [Ktedonobacteraceae bacterium]